MKTFAAYLAAVAVVVFWWLVVQVAIRCDRSLRADWAAGETFDHFDPALARVDRLHAELFGSDE